MLHLNSPMATSTPLHKAGTGLVLKEKQVNAEGHRRQTLNEYKSKNIGKPILHKSRAKENAVKPSQNGLARATKVEDDEKAAKRRQQAVEAMMIQEQRRLRMSQQVRQQVLADELEKMTVSSAESCDELIEKKRMEAKKLKQKRIMAFIAEQEFQKNKKLEENASSKVDFLSSSFRIKTRRCLYKPRVPGYDAPLSKVPEETIFPMSVVSRKLYNRVIIRYTKDEIRSMNPYGYYFL